MRKPLFSLPKSARSFTPNTPLLWPCTALPTHHMPHIRRAHDPFTSTSSRCYPGRALMATTGHGSWSVSVLTADCNRPEPFTPHTSAAPPCWSPDAKPRVSKVRLRVVARCGGLGVSAIARNGSSLSRPRPKCQSLKLQLQLAPQHNLDVVCSLPPREPSVMHVIRTIFVLNPLGGHHLGPGCWTAAVHMMCLLRKPLLVTLRRAYHSIAFCKVTNRNAVPGFIDAERH